MAIEFRCEKCGKLLNVDSDPGSTVKCPHCHKKVAVPAVLASLPHPQVIANVGGPPPLPPPPPPPEGQAEAALEEEHAEGDDLVIGVMAKIMPWVISVFFHVGLILIMMLVSTVIIAKTLPENIIIPDAEFSDDPGGVVNPGESDPSAPASQSRYQVQAQGYSSREAAIPGDTGKTDKKVLLIGLGSGGTSGGSLAPFGLTTGGSGSGPKSNFFGHGGNAHHVCYVIDRSGSMVDTFDFVRHEMLISISRLRPMQDFHIILFSSGTTIENSPRRLVTATNRNKEDAAKFLEPIRAEGQTDPVPALNRAFEVLVQADPRKPGKLIYLLTDGVFPDNARVIDAVRRTNQKKNVLINTYLYGHKPEEAVKVMTDIAKENGGRYKYVSSDE